MYVNIGGDMILNAKDVVAALNAKQANRPPINAQLLDMMESNPRTYIITRTRIYASQVSTRTLQRRMRST